MMSLKMHFPAKLAATLLLAGLAGTAIAATSNGFANGDFESTANNGGLNFATGWQAAPTGNPALLSDIAHSGSHAALLTVPNGFGGSTLFQNSTIDGGLAALGAANVGDAPVLSFWAKGDVSTTGNVLFSLRYLAANGAILASSGNRFFQNDINPNSWTQISFQGQAIPAGTQSMFLEMNTAVGPLLDGRANAVYIDDIQLTLTTAAVPEPASYALLLVGMGLIGAVSRRRQA